MSRARTGTGAVGLLLASLMVFPVACDGQTAQRLSLQVSGLGQSHPGSDERSYGGEAQIRYNPGRLSMGAGIQATRGCGTCTHERTSYGPYIEPRFILGASGERAAVYAALRVGLLRTSWTRITGSGDTFPGSFLAYYNGGAGVLVVLAGRVNLDFSATAGVEEGDLDYTARVGLAIGLGG